MARSRREPPTFLEEAVVIPAEILERKRVEKAARAQADQQRDAAGATILQEEKTS